MCVIAVCVWLCECVCVWVWLCVSVSVRMYVCVHVVRVWVCMCECDCVWVWVWECMCVSMWCECESVCGVCVHMWRCEWAVSVCVCPCEGVSGQYLDDHPGSPTDGGKVISANRNQNNYQRNVISISNASFLLIFSLWEVFLFTFCAHSLYKNFFWENNFNELLYEKSFSMLEK